MTTFYIEQFGCRATQADAAAMERQLLERGYAAAEDGAGAQVVVVNTCTVTASADSQARQAIRAIHRSNPAARIVVTGCYAQRAPEELAQLEGVSWVVGNSHQPEIPDLVDRITMPPSRSSHANLFPLERLTASPLPAAWGPARILAGDMAAQTEVLVAPVEGGESSRTRPTLKIQDGCNNRCSFCVIPFVRGRGRSLTPARVIEEIRRLVAAGSREVVLSGINLGSYGRDMVPRTHLGELLRRILDETRLERLRISSIEPMDVTRDLVALVASTDRIAQHFHVPLQSGSDRILAAMHRWYRAEHYARHIELIHEQLHDAAIGADLIAGFPGETDADHRATLELVRRLPFTYLHVFGYSHRPGTRAADLAGEVPPRVIKQRSRELRALAAEKNAAFRAAHAGLRVRVLTLNRLGEDSAGSWTEALSGNYLKTRVAGRWPAGRFLEAVVRRTDGTHLIATPLAS